MNLVLEEKKVKRKKSKPRFISVQPNDLEQFMKDVGEYKQILRSIGMYDLCQNWKQARGQQRKEESDAKKKAKILRKKEKESMGLVWFDMKEKQKSQEAYLKQLQGEDDDEDYEANQQILDIQEYNRAYQNQNSDEESDINLEKNIFTEGKVKKDKLNTSTQEQQVIIEGNESSFEKGSRNNASLIEKSYVERSPNNNDADGLENLFSEQHDSRYEQEKQPKKGKKKISKKKVSLINKSLRDKQQFRSQEHSQVDNIDELIADQDMSMLEKLPVNGNLERSLLSRLDKSNISEDEQQKDEDESQFRETENEYKQISEEQEENYQREGENEELGQEQGDKSSLNSSQIDSNNITNKQKNKMKKKNKKDKKVKKMQQIDVDTQNQETQQLSNKEDTSESKVEVVQKKIKKKKKKNEHTK